MNTIETLASLALQGMSEDAAVEVFWDAADELGWWTEARRKEVRDLRRANGEFFPRNASVMRACAAVILFGGFPEKGC